MPKIIRQINPALLLFIAMAFNGTVPISAQDASEFDGRDGRELLLRNFRPNHALRVKQTDLTQAKYPTVDVHSHFYYRLKHADGEALARRRQDEDLRVGEPGWDVVAGAHEIYSRREPSSFDRGMRWSSQWPVPD